MRKLLERRVRPRAAVGRRELFVAIGAVLSGLLLAACPRHGSYSDAPPSRSSGGRMRSY